VGEDAPIVRYHENVEDGKKAIAAITPFLHLGRTKRIDYPEVPVIAAIQFGIGLAQVESLEDKQVEAINRYAKIDLPVLPTLFFEFQGMNDRDIADQTTMLQSLCGRKTNPEDMDQLWKARHHAYFAVHALVPGAKILVADICIPISRLAECTTETKNDLGQRLFSCHNCRARGRWQFSCSVRP
jgi:D-lactate dehydrogenase (cytochrome)